MKVLILLSLIFFAAQSEARWKTEYFLKVYGEKLYILVQYPEGEKPQTHNVRIVYGELENHQAKSGTAAKVNKFNRVSPGESLHDDSWDHIEGEDPHGIRFELQIWNGKWLVPYDTYLRRGIDDTTSFERLSPTENNLKTFGIDPQNPIKGNDMSIGPLGFHFLDFADLKIDDSFGALIDQNDNVIFEISRDTKYLVESMPILKHSFVFWGNLTRGQFHQQVMSDRATGKYHTPQGYREFHLPPGIQGLKQVSIGDKDNNTTHSILEALYGSDSNGHRQLVVNFPSGKVTYRSMTESKIEKLQASLRAGKIRLLEHTQTNIPTEASCGRILESISKK